MSSLQLDDLWQPLPVCVHPVMRRWLLDRGSLTRRIQLRCREFSVTLMSQRLARVNYDEGVLFGIRREQRALVREVSLNCGSRPVVFAHSVVDPTALRGPWHMLSTLGARPLGAALFADPCVRRYPLRFRQLSPSHALYRHAAALMRAPPALLWARRSMFVLRESRLLVTEVFLPGILALAP